MTSPINLDVIRQVKAKHELALLTKKNVVGVGIGFRERKGKLTEEVALVVSVSKKLPPNEVETPDRIPTEIEGVPVDVKEVGEIRALS